MPLINLTIDDVINAVSRDNQNTPLGNIEEGNFRYLLRSEGQVENPEQLGDIIVKEIAGRPVYLAEMAVIEDSHKDIEAISRINGMASVNIEIRKEANANPILISDAAQQLIPELEELYQGKLRLVIGRDQSEFIRDTMQMVKDNASLGGFFAICVLFIFLKSYRSTIIIGIGIPIAILTTFGLLSQKADITLNLMTLGGLALGIGMMIDNAIVVMENIYRFYTDNPEKDKKEMAAQATEEVLMPIFASTATTVAVFLPIGFVPAMVGEVFFNMSLSIIFSLLSSLTVAVTLIPMLCSRFLVLDSQYLEDIIARMYLALIKWVKTHVIKASIAVVAIILLPTIALTFGLKNQIISQIIAKLPMAATFSNSAMGMLGLSLVIAGALLIAPLVIALVLKAFNLLTIKLLFPAFDFLIMGTFRRAYVYVLSFLVSSAILRIAYFTLVISLFLISFKFQPAMTFFPTMDRGELTIDFETPEGTSVSQTDRITAQMEEILSKSPEIDKIITNSQVGKGTISLALIPSSQRIKTTTEVIDEARDEISKIAGIRTINYREPQMGAPSTGKSIQIEVLGPDFDQIEKICLAIFERIKDLEGIKDLEDGVKTGRPEFRLVFDREKIRDLDLNLSKIAGMVRSHVFGTLAGKYRESNDEFDIRVEASDEARAAIARFRELDISLENGRFVKLSQIADFRPASGYSTIERKIRPAV